jgi:hypothetical protein
VSNQNALLFLDRGLIEFTFKFNKPIKSTNLDSLFIYIDSTTQVQFNRENLHFNSKKLILSVSQPIDKRLFEKPPVESPVIDSVGTTRKRGEPPTLEERANLIAQKQKARPTNLIQQGRGAFISVDNDSSSSSNYQLKILKTADLAVILVEISTSENFIVNLLDKDFRIIQTKSNSQNIKFEELQPGQYQVQLIIDKNKNGKWDAGNIFEKREPEPIIYYIYYETETSIVPLKPNWEVGPLLITY